VVLGKQSVAKAGKELALYADVCMFLFNNSVSK